MKLKCLTHYTIANCHIISYNQSWALTIYTKRSHFIPTESISIYLNTASVDLANSLMENESATSINQENCFYQLRQIRSKFHCLSIYTLCLSFSKTASDIVFRPYTIWIMYEYDSPQKTDSQAQMLSSIFQNIAYSVIRNGSSACVGVNCFKNVQDQLKGNATKDTLTQILELEEGGFITIINNFALGRLLQSLADSMVTSIKNANLNAAELLAKSLQA